MVITYKKFEKRYLNSCMEMIRTTWPFEDELINPKNPEYIYKYYVLNCSNWSEHLELLVDENEQAQGILFGSIEDTSYAKAIKFYLTQWKIQLGMWWHILSGNLGNRKQAIAVYKNMCKHDADGEVFADEYDSEVNLFILSPSLRGQGYGRELMNRYMKFCRNNDLDNVFLWTTTDCNFHFYERYGFKERQRFSFKELSNNGTPTESESIVFYKAVQ
jgi:ribosomal protein S18 acetylase RimI-like enzyme